MSQAEITDRNSDFWDELCGTALAKSLGIADSSIESLRKFDDWYLDFYPYLFDHIPFSALAGKDVLEVGLGYGTVSQKLAESGANYTGLDVAAGPVNMVNHRLGQRELPGKAVQGSILEPDFAKQSFDTIVAIGCLHHTGNLKLAIDRCHDLLKPGGSLVFMIYYAYSYRRFRMATLTTLSYFLKETFGYRGVVGSSAERERIAYDSGSDGAGAPHTDWISARSIAHFCRDYSSVSSRVENIDQEPPFRNTPRAELLKTGWPARFGLDLYVTATK